jgi:hypothetical protein
VITFPLFIRLVKNYRLANFHAAYTVVPWKSLHATEAQKLGFDA